MRALLASTRVAPCRARHLACTSGGKYFGNEGIRGGGGFGGQGGDDLAKLLGGQGGAGGLGNLGGGIDLSPSNAQEDDPLNYDPEGLFKGNTTLQDGHIERRMAFKGIETEEEMKKELERQQAVALEEAEKRRAAAVVPLDPAALVDFFLNCDAADMEYFVAKVRSRLDGAFFAAIDNAIGQERFVEEPNEDALAELQGLRAYVSQTMQAQDTVKKGILSATDRLKKLLSARDKKEVILEMAAANEIDFALIQLLQQNIDGALAAKQPDAAAVMTKVRDACSKHVLKTPKGQTERVRAALQQEKAHEGEAKGAKEGERMTPGGLIMP